MFCVVGCGGQGTGAGIELVKAEWLPSKIHFQIRSHTDGGVRERLIVLLNWGRVGIDTSPSKIQVSLPWRPFLFLC